MSFASLYGQNDAVTAPVAVDPAALEAARVRPAEVRPAQVPEEMERFRVRPLEQIMGHDLRAQREALDRRAATRSGQWAEEAAKRSAEAAEQAEELGLPMTWTDQRGTVRKFLGFDDRGIFQFLESHGAYQLMQGGVVDIQADGSMGYPYSGTFKPLGFWELQLPRVTHENFEDVATSDPRMVIAPNQTAATNTDHATRVGDVLIGTGLGFDSLTGDWALGASFEGTGIAWDQNNEFAEMSGLAIDELFVHNHSYGFVAGWTRAPLFVGAQVETKVWIGDLDISISQSHLFGAYNSVSADIDEVVRMRPFTLPVWSAGNAAGIGPNDLPGSEWLEVYQNFQFHSDGYYYTWNDGIAGFHNGTYFWPASAVTAYSSSDHAVNMDSAASPTSISGMPAENGGTSGFDSVPHGYGVAKNVLTVGSQQNWTGSISGFSSRGPVDDGRVKPDIVTVGEEVRTSTATSDTSYGYSWGTSFSAPAVAGGIHLLSEHQNALWGDLEPLLSSTYRALVVHTAQDLGSPGPNYTYGWGAARFGHAAGVIENNYNSGQRTFLKEVVLPDQEEISFTIRAAGGGEIRVTTAWNDPAGAPQAEVLNPRDPQLVNNLAVC